MCLIHVIQNQTLHNLIKEIFLKHKTGSSLLCLKLFKTHPSPPSPLIVWPPLLSPASSHPNLSLCSKSTLSLLQLLEPHSLDPWAFVHAAIYPKCMSPSFLATFSHILVEMLLSLGQCSLSTEWTHFSAMSSPYLLAQHVIAMCCSYLPAFLLPSVTQDCEHLASRQCFLQFLTKGVEHSNFQSLSAELNCVSTNSGPGKWVPNPKSLPPWSRPLVTPCHLVLCQQYAPPWSLVCTSLD